MLTKQTIRKQAQRAVPTSGERCCKCGCQSGLTRHHSDYSKPLEVEIMCRSCHAKHHAEETKLKSVACKICKELFTPTRTRRSVICQKPECRAAKGAEDAAKRWANRPLTAPCNYCQAEFTKTRPRQTTCGRLCGNKLAWQNKQ